MYTTYVLHRHMLIHREDVSRIHAAERLHVAYMESEKLRLFSYLCYISLIVEQSVVGHSFFLTGCGKRAFPRENLHLACAVPVTQGSDKFL